MRKILILLVALAVGGCTAPYWSVPIGPPSGPSYGVAPPAVVAPGASGMTVYRPDPTRGLIDNWSKTIFAKVWINSGPPSPPMLELGPEMSMPVFAPLETIRIYVEGRIKTGPYGWVSVGSYRRELNLRNYSYNYGGYSWRFPIYDGDFPR